MNNNEKNENKAICKIYKRTIFVWVGKIISVFSIALVIMLSICYLFKPDTCAVLTFFPAWVWGLSGAVFSSGGLLYKKRIYIALVLCWLFFVLVFAEEPRSLLRSIYIHGSNWENHSNDKRITVVSINCAGGNMEAFREIFPYNPDIVLIQEVPADKEGLLTLAEAVFGNETSIVYGPDTAIIARGELQETPLPKTKNIFMTQARFLLKSGSEIEVMSIRLKPPAIDINILSRNSWTSHKEDRRLRRKQVEQVVEEINQVSDKVPIILGGDFNVNAKDGSLRALQHYLSDTFTQGGVGWGHTALNSVPLFRVDQIWASSDFRTISVFAKKTKHSDHRMVICNLEIK